MKRNLPVPLRYVRRRDQAGNAYLVTVMVMIIVTLLGLALGAVTQTEMLIGSRERNNQRVFYLGEGGLNLAVARFMVTSDLRAARIEMEMPPAYDFTATGGFAGHTMTGVIRLAPIKSPFLNYVQLGEAGAPEYDDSMQAVRLPITVRAAMETASGQTLAQRRMSSLIDITPWAGNVSGSGLDLNDSEIEYN